MAKACRASVEKCRIRRRIQQDPIAEIFQEFLFSLDRSHILGSGSAQDPTGSASWGGQCEVVCLSSGTKWGGFEKKFSRC